MLEFNTAKTDEFDEVLDNIAFMYSILMIIFHRNSGWLLKKNHYLLSPHATYEIEYLNTNFAIACTYTVCCLLLCTFSCIEKFQNLEFPESWELKETIKIHLKSFTMWNLDVESNFWKFWVLSNAAVVTTTIFLYSKALFDYSKLKKGRLTNPFQAKI